MDEKDSFIEPEKPAEIIELEEAQAAIHDVLWWKKRLAWTGWIMYAIGGFSWIVLGNDRALIIILMAFAVLIFNATVLHWKLLQRRMICQNLLNPLLRKQALPLYHDMLEKFSDQPHLHIHLAEDGTIIITNRKNKGDQ